MKLLHSVIGGGLMAAAGFVLGMHVHPEGVQPYPSPDGQVTVSGVNCPEEDSCSIDYSHGQWTVTEVTP